MKKFPADVTPPPAHGPNGRTSLGAAKLVLLGMVVGAGLTAVVVAALAAAYWPGAASLAGGMPQSTQPSPATPPETNPGTKPGAVGDAEALASHPWWRGKVTAADVEGILTLATSRGEGCVFFNDRGQAVWALGTSKEAPIPGQVPLVIVHAQADALAPEIAALGRNRGLVFLTPGAGRRYSRQEAVNLVADALSSPKYDQLVQQSDKALADLLALGSKKPDPPVPQAPVVVPPANGQPAPPDVPALMKALRSGAVADKVSAAQVVMKLGDAARPASRALCEAALDANSDVRRAALEALNAVRPDLAPLVGALVAGDASQKGQACLGLVELKEDASPATPVLVAQVPKNLEGNVRLSRDVTLALGGVADNDPRALDALVAAASLRCINRGYDDNRPAFSRALAEFGRRHKGTRPAIVPVLIKVANNDDGLGEGGRTRVVAIEALGSFGRDARAAAEPLRKLRLDPDEAIRRAVSEALTGISP